MVVLRACAALIAATLIPAALAAQNLPRVHVSALSLRADHDRVMSGESFHVTVHVRLTGDVGQPGLLNLPSIGNARVEGNETQRRIEHDSADIQTVLTLSVPTPGTFDLAPAYVDAWDPTLHRAVRFSSNALSIAVIAAPQDPVRATPATWTPLALAITVVAVLVAAAGIKVWATRKMPARALRAQIPMPAPTAAPLEANLERALARLIRSADDATLRFVQVALFAELAIPPDTTLADARRFDMSELERQVLTELELARFADTVERERAMTVLRERLMQAVARKEAAS
jgi:hypothetical protein